MTLIANVLTGLVALAHVGILVLEMFFWDHPVGRRIFVMTPEVSAASKVIAMNQGLYNGFLAAGLIARADKIVIFRDTLRRDFGHNPDLLRQQVLITVRHELAHHVGFDELGVRDLGL